MDRIIEALSFIFFFLFILKSYIKGVVTIILSYVQFVSHGIPNILILVYKNVIKSWIVNKYVNYIYFIVLHVATNVSDVEYWHNV